MATVCATRELSCSWGICSRSTKKSAITPRGSRNCFWTNLFLGLLESNSQHSLLTDSAAQHGEGSAWQHKFGVRLGLNRGDRSRAVRVGVTFGALRVPDVLRGSERRY